VRITIFNGRRTQARSERHAPGERAANRLARQTGPVMSANKEAAMRMSSKRPGFTDHMSKHRFRLTLLACALALGAMLAAVHSTAGFAPIWTGPAVSAAS
jgi:hypothetical protein